MLQVHIGQCGNQLGHALLNRLSLEEQDDVSSSSHASPFFRPTESSSSSGRVARAVLIDMEPKVIQQCLAATNTKAWIYDVRNTFTKQSGSGNNWAFGYMVHGTQTADAIHTLLQQEAERNDFVRGVLTLQSAAGGTGSGVGSFVAEQLVDAFPSSALLHGVVWPYASGEVIVQNYNAMLTMASLCDGTSDGVLVLQNDIASEICKRLLRNPRPSFDAMNDVLATQMASVLLPVHDESSDPISRLSRQLCHHPGYKLLDLKIVPQMPPQSKQFSTHTWPGILKHLHQMHIANASLEEGINWRVDIETSKVTKCVANALYLRGWKEESTTSDAIRAFEHPKLYPSWHPHPFVSYTTSKPFNQYEKTASLLSNSSAIVPLLESTLAKAHEMFLHGAYVHPYERYGIDRAFFQEAFLRIDQIIQNYQSL